MSAPIPGIDRPLRIVQAAAFPFPSPQGSQVFVRGMARALARRGHEVTVACYAHGLGTPDPEYRVVRTPAIPGYRNLRACPDLVKPALDPALAVQITRHLERALRRDPRRAPGEGWDCADSQRAPAYDGRNKTDPSRIAWPET